MPYKNKEKRNNYAKEYMKEWRKNNSEKIKEIKKRYRKKNKEKIKEYNMQYEKTEGAKKRTEKYRGTDRFKDTDRRWNKTEKGKIHRQREDTKRRMRGKEIINTLTSEEWLDILEKYNYRCVYCDAEFEVENMPTKDHIIPISKGGHNIRENIVPACRSCNSKKNNKLDYDLIKIGKI